MLLSKRRTAPPWGRTPGIYGHLPKYWNCQTIRPETYRHPSCRHSRHRSYNGYVSLVLPGGRSLTWHYWGKSFLTGKRFEVRL